MQAARTSLADAARDPARSPGGIIRDVENAVRHRATDPTTARPMIPRSLLVRSQRESRASRLDPRRKIAGL